MLSFRASSASSGSTRIEQSGKRIVGTLRLPRFVCLTKASPALSASMSTQVKPMWWRVRKALARTQSEHHAVPYMTMALADIDLSLRRSAGYAMPPITHHASLAVEASTHRLNLSAGDLGCIIRSGQPCPGHRQHLL